MKSDAQPDNLLYVSKMLIRAETFCEYDSLTDQYEL